MAFALSIRVAAVTVLTAFAPLCTAFANGWRDSGSLEDARPDTVESGATLEEIYAGDRFFEGPSWDAARGLLYVTSFGREGEQVLSLSASGDVTVWLDHTEGLSGTFYSSDGFLLGVQGAKRRVVRIDARESEPRVLWSYQGDDDLLRPVDICETARGHVYFTDADFSHRQKSGVYRLAPDGVVSRVITDMPLPKGIIASLDGSRLYVSDAHLKWWRTYPVRPDGTVGAGRVFFDPRTRNRQDPEGMTIDELGNLYFCGRGGVWVVAPTGRGVGFIPVPELTSNATFGGPDGRTLFLTCRGKVYRLAMRVRGGQFHGLDDPRADPEALSETSPQGESERAPARFGTRGPSGFFDEGAEGATDDAAQRLNDGEPFGRAVEEALDGAFDGSPRQ